MFWQAVDTATVADLNERVHALLQDAGLVGDDTVRLADHLSAGVGDRVVSRRNDRRLRYGDDHWVRNGTLWTVTATRSDGSLDLTDPDGTRALPPATYVTEHVDLGYATTTARSQGVTADITHNLVGPGTAREDLYVAMSRGRTANPLYVAVDAPGTDCLPGEQAGDPLEILTTVLATTRLRDLRHGPLGPAPPRLPARRSPPTAAEPARGGPHTPPPARPAGPQPLTPAPDEGEEAMTISTDHELLTVAEAAERLRVTTRFIRMLIADGTLPALRLGRRAIRLRKDDVDHVLRPIDR